MSGTRPTAPEPKADIRVYYVRCSCAWSRTCETMEAARAAGDVHAAVHRGKGVKARGPIAPVRLGAWSSSEVAS